MTTRYYIAQESSQKHDPILQASTWLGGTNVSVSPDSQMLGKRLAKLRKERGITQVELAKALNVSQSNMSDYERGILRLHGELIMQIMRTLEISSDELFDLNDDDEKDEAAPKRATKNKKFLTRLRQVEQLPKRDRDALMRTIDTYLSKVS